MEEAQETEVIVDEEAKEDILEDIPQTTTDDEKLLISHAEETPSDEARVSFAEDKGEKEPALSIIKPISAEIEDVQTIDVPLVEGETYEDEKNNSELAYNSNQQDVEQEPEIPDEEPQELFAQEENNDDIAMDPMATEESNTELQEDAVSEHNQAEEAQVEEEATVDKKIPKLKTTSTISKHGTIIAPKREKIRTAEVIYRAAAPVIQDPTVPLDERPGPDCFPGSTVRGATGGSNRQIADMISREFYGYRQAVSRAWEPNPACTVPMRARGYGHRSSVKVAPTGEEWRRWEERDKDRRDHELAKKLGYETLVGNILYIDIPGGKDINRSWQNFLSDNIMDWGFPYKKGSIERPRMKLQEPYLAHQVKEQLWKFPRSRTFQITQDD